MRVLILGATGLAGSALSYVLGRRATLNVTAAMRAPNSRANLPLFSRVECVESGDLSAVTNPEDADQGSALEELLDTCAPDIVVNCLAAAGGTGGGMGAPAGALRMMAAVVPRRLAGAMAVRRDSTGKSGRVIHVSTDGVFSGRRAATSATHRGKDHTTVIAPRGYCEKDIADATDIYGQLKWLGEDSSDHCINLRTSVLGHELARGGQGRRSLLEWCIAQSASRGGPGRCQGWGNVHFSPLTAIEFGEAVALLIDAISAENSSASCTDKKSKLSGPLHASGPRISKLELIQKINLVYKLGLDITPSARPSNDISMDMAQEGDTACSLGTHPNPDIDLTLDSTAFRLATGYTTKSWEHMLTELYASKKLWDHD